MTLYSAWTMQSGSGLPSPLRIVNFSSLLPSFTLNASAFISKAFSFCFFRFPALLLCFFAKHAPALMKGKLLKPSYCSSYCCNTTIYFFSFFFGSFSLKKQQQYEHIVLKKKRVKNKWDAWESWCEAPWLHQIRYAATQRRSQPASQPANGSKSEVRERNKEGHSGGRFRIGKCHSPGKFQPQNMKLENKEKDIPPRGDTIFWKWNILSQTLFLIN